MKFNIGKIIMMQVLRECSTEELLELRESGPHALIWVDKVLEERNEKTNL